MRANLKIAMQERWQAALRQRVLLSPRSIVPVLDALLARQHQASQDRLPARSRNRAFHPTERRQSATIGR